MDSNKLQTYLRAQQVSLQWFPFLRAMAQELSETTTAKDLRPLFVKVGKRMANDSKDLFTDIKSLAQLQDNLNDFWERINWGWVELRETNGAIEMAHQAAPLAEAFGNESMAWSTGLLEGFYHSVFAVLGASDTMAVREVGVANDGLTIQLRLGR
jgi:hypothetical protein